VPVADQAEVKADFWKIFDDLDAEPGEAAIAAARARVAHFTARYDKRFPAAVACLHDDLPSLLTHLRFPVEHQRRIRHSNFIERTFGETRRRVKVIGRLPGERTCVSLVWAVLDRASRGWRGVVMNPAAVRHLQEIRHQLLDPPIIDNDDITADVETVTAAA